MDVLDRADLPFPHSLPGVPGDFSPMMRPAPPTWRKPGLGRRLCLPALRHGGQSRSTLKTAGTSCAAASAARTPG